MKLNRIITLWALAAALTLSATSLLAQDNNGGGGQPGGGGQGGGGPGRNRNFDPAQFQQRMMDGVRDQLGFTNDTDWSAVQPLIQKVMDDRRDMGGAGGMMRMMRPRNNDQGNPRRNFFGQPSPEADALQKALDANAPAGQIKDLLEKYQASQKAKQTKLESAQSDLRAVLTVKQEAQATLLGLLN